MRPHILFLSLLWTLASATITIESTGERIPSYPDRLMGDVFDDEHFYLARMQHLPENLDLCLNTLKPHQTYFITVPSDRPVVLLARGAYCSDLSKARLASLNIQPAGVVKYLIIYDTRSSRDAVRNLQGLNEIEIKAATSVEDDISSDDEETDELHIMQGKPAMVRKIQIPEEDEFVRKKKKHTVDPYVSVGVLHVNRESGASLMHALIEQSDSTRESGGPHVLLDGRTFDSTKFIRNLLFWMGLIIMIVGCCCSLILSARVQSILEQDNTNNQGTARPVRRRMTPDQVEEMLPIEIYRQGNEVVSMDGSLLEARIHKIDLSSCSVCLDEYEPGDHVRCLPCGHTFHSTCIAKWLIERSCTCPLCKLDLLPESDDEEDNEDYVELQDGSSTDDGNNNGNDDDEPRQSIWDLFIQVRNNMLQRQQQQQQQDGDLQQQQRDLTEPLLDSSIENSDTDEELGEAGVEMATEH